VKLNSITDIPGIARGGTEFIVSAAGHCDEFRRVRVVYLASHQFYR
jgi:hypothetical protein